MKVKVFIGTSLDGFIARKNGDFDWLTPFANDEAVQSYEQFISGIDVIVIGKGTYEKVLSFPIWPYQEKVFVLSTSIRQVADPLKDKVTVLSMKPRELLQYISSQGYSNIYIDGGKVVQDFLQEDLVDELTISRAPILIGSGIPLFDHVDFDIPFEHIKTDIYTNGLVRSYYKRKRN
jgi:dihydrofolate reductase